MGGAGMLTLGLNVQAQDVIGLSNHFDVQLKRDRYMINTMHLVVFWKLLVYITTVSSVLNPSPKWFDFEKQVYAVLDLQIYA